jgi:C4-dicarboxylate transporter DctM subunit
MVIFIIVVFFILMLMGIPIAFVLGLTPFIYWIIEGGVPSIIFPQRMFSGSSSFVLMAIPFFVLAGNLMSYGGVTKRIIAFTQAIVGNISGGLGVVNVVSSMLFGGISGSANADVAALGTALIPEMVNEGYDVEFSTAITVTSATVGPIIPPSISMVIYGSLANVSIGALFLGGIIPGILIGLFLIILVLIKSSFSHYPRTGKFSFKLIKSTFKDAILALVMPILIVGGILSGAFTPTEASAVAVVYAFVVGCFIYKGFKIKDLFKIVVKSVVVSASILIIISFTCVIGWIIAEVRIPQLLGEWLLSITDNKYLILMFINLILLLMGTTLDPSAGLILFTPILIPIAKLVGINPIHLGVIMVLNLTIGLTTPPVGTCLYIGSTISKLPVQKLFVAMIPYLISNIIVLLLITYLPQLVLFLALKI